VLPCIAQKDEGEETEHPRRRKESGCKEEIDTGIQEEKKRRTLIWTDVTLEGVETRRRVGDGATEKATATVPTELSRLLKQTMLSVFRLVSPMPWRQRQTDLP
jgi:hypothetical protein